MTLSPPVSAPACPSASQTIYGTVPGAPEGKVQAPRLSASRVPSIKAVRLSPPGSEVTLINISATGTLVECARRLNPGSNVVVRFDGTLDPSTVPGRVVRCSVAAIGREGALKYQVGVEFSRRIELDDAPNPASEPPEAPTPAPVPVPPPQVLRNRW